MNVVLITAQRASNDLRLNPVKWFLQSLLVYNQEHSAKKKKKLAQTAEQTSLFSPMTIWKPSVLDCLGSFQL